MTLCAFRSRCKLAGKNTLSNHSAMKRGKTCRGQFLRYSRRKRDTNGDLNNFESKHTFVFNEIPQKNLKRRDRSFYDESYFEATPSDYSITSRCTNWTKYQKVRMNGLGNQERERKTHCFTLTLTSCNLIMTSM